MPPTFDIKCHAKNKASTDIIELLMNAWIDKQIPELTFENSEWLTNVMPDPPVVGTCSFLRFDVKLLDVSGKCSARFFTESNHVLFSRKQ